MSTGDQQGTVMQGGRGAGRPIGGQPPLPGYRSTQDPRGGVDEILDVEPQLRRQGSGAPGRPAPRPRRRYPWRPLSLVGAALLAAVIVGILDYQPTSMAPRPSGVRVATPAPTMPAPTPTGSMPPATLGPYWPAQIGIPVITVPIGLAHVAARDPTASPSASPSGAPFASPSASGSVAAPGPFVYWPEERPDAVTVVDIGRGTHTPLPLPLKKGEMFGGAVTDGTWLVVELAEQFSDTNPCPTSIPWRLLAARVGPDGRPRASSAFTLVAHGSRIGYTLVGQDCVFAPQFQFQLEAGRLAWAEDRPDGSTSIVHVRTLGAATTINYASTRHVVQLALSGDAVAWVESSDPLAWTLQPSRAMQHDGSAPDWRVMSASLADTRAYPVDIGVDGTSGSTPLPQIILDGSTVIATRLDGQFSAASIVRADPGGLQVIDEGTAERRCEAWHADAGVLFLTCFWPQIEVTTADQRSALALPAVWTPAHGLQAVTVGDGDPLMAWWMSIRGGWAILAGDPGWIALPLSAMTRP